MTRVCPVWIKNCLMKQKSPSNLQVQTWFCTCIYDTKVWRKSSKAMQENLLKEPSLGKASLDEYVILITVWLSLSLSCSLSFSLSRANTLKEEGAEEDARAGKDLKSRFDAFPAAWGTVFACLDLVESYIVIHMVSSCNWSGLPSCTAWSNLWNLGTNEGFADIQQN